MCGDVNTCTCGYMFIRYQGRILPVSLYLYYLMFFETWFLAEPRDYDFCLEWMASQHLVFIYHCLLMLGLWVSALLFTF